MSRKYRGLENALGKALDQVAATDKIKNDRLRFWRREMGPTEMKAWLRAEKKREEKECPMKGRMSQCSSTMKCRHLTKN